MASATQCCARCRSARPRCSIRSGRRRRPCSRRCADTSRRCFSQCRRFMPQCLPIPTASQKTCRAGYDSVFRPASRSTWRSLASRTVAEAVDGPGGPGPVHVNLPFREPLVRMLEIGEVQPGRPDGAPWYQVMVEPRVPTPAVVAQVVHAARTGVRGVIVAGAGCGDSDEVAAASAVLGWPVLADPRSALRRPGSTLIAAADGILRSDSFAASHRPELVLRLGAPWASKVVNSFLASSGSDGIPVVAVVAWGEWVDPDRSVTTMVSADPTAVCRAIVDGMRKASKADQGHPGRVHHTTWLDSWQAAESAAQAALGESLGDPVTTHHGRSTLKAGWTEPALARGPLAALRS